MRNSMLSTLALSAGIVGLGAHGARAQDSPARHARGPLDCTTLRQLHLPHTTIDLAERVEAGAFKPPVGGFPGLGGNFAKLPAFCRVAGSIHPTADSDIRFELWLPVNGWNHRFMQTGNGGAAGSIVYGSLAELLSRGYAVANTDTGHQGGGLFAWAAGHPQKIIDYDYRAVHDLTVTGKAITTAGYGVAPKRSYWVGCSTGGRQGLKEAERYPTDYDAIIAGSPASNWTPLMALSIVIQRNLGPGGLGIDKLALLKRAAIAQCDALDGVKDGVISEPKKCVFDPASLQCRAGETEHCLSASEVEAANRIYRGVVDKGGKEWIPGTGPASELQWAAYATPQFSIGTSYFSNVVMHDPKWGPANFDVGTDMPRAERVDGGRADAMNPDLGRFIARGGKLITYHGTYDGLIPSGNSVRYYESVLAKLGAARADEGVRFYLVPGMEHCSGGEGAFQIDWLSALENWVEKGQAPRDLLGAHPAIMPGPPGSPPARGRGFTRPICPYPQIAKYKGSGDTAEAASFFCAAP
jgi:feruloyl esterase